MRASFKRATEEMTDEQIAERDLEWLQKHAGDIISAPSLVDDPAALARLLRGVARTANKTALYYEQRHGLPRGSTGGRPRNT
jgi:hypothetical protein